MTAAVRATALAIGAMCVACYHAIPAHTACPARGARARDVGVVADPLSALNNSEVRVGGEWSVAGEENTNEMHAWTPLLGARYMGEHLTAYGEWDPVLFTGDGSVEQRLKNESSYASVGDARVSLGYRSIHTDLGGLYRRGIAVYGELGIDLADGGHAGVSEIDVGNRLGDLRPFERTRFMSGQYYGQHAEIRYELVGCHAPFLHATGGITARKDFDPGTIALPFSVTVGAHPNPMRNIWWLPRTTFYAGYDALIGKVRVMQNGWDLEHRMRLGIQLEPGRVLGVETLPIRLEYSTTFGASDALILGAYIIIPLATEGS